MTANDSLHIKFVPQIIPRFARLRGSQPGVLPNLHGLGIGIFYVTLNYCCLFVRYGLQFLAGDCLLEVDEGWDAERAVGTRSSLLRLALSLLC